MKEIIIHVDESAYECVLGMLKLCQKVQVVSEEGCVHTEIDMDSCVAKALNVLYQRHVFRYTRDISPASPHRPSSSGKRPDGYGQAAHRQQ